MWLASCAKLSAMDRARQDRALAVDEADATALGEPISGRLGRRAAPLLAGAAVLWIRVAAVLILLAPLLLLLWVLARG